MSAPPSMKPSALLLKLLETPAPSEVIDYPRNDADGKPLFRVRIMVLRGEDIEAANVAAITMVRDRYKVDLESLPPGALDIWREVIGDALAREIVSRSVVEVEPVDPDERPLRYQRVFPTADAAGSLPPGEIAVLFAAYQLAQHKYGPLESSLSRGEAEAWIERLREAASGARFLLSRLDSRARGELLLFLLQKEPTGSTTSRSQWTESAEQSEFTSTNTPTGTGSFTRHVAESSPSDNLADAVDAARLLLDGDD